MSSYTYHIDEGALQLPSGFRDASVNAFEWVHESGPITLTVQRERRDPNSPFEAFFHKITQPYPKLFTAYAEEEPMEMAMDVPVLGKRFRWRAEEGVMYNHQVLLDLGSSVILLTAGGRAASRGRIDEVMHGALSGLRLRERGSA